MNSHQTLISKQIMTTTELLKQTRPSYEQILDFYQTLFIAQEESKTDLNLPPVIIKKQKLDVKRANNLPLIDTAEFKIDIKHAGNLLKTLCQMTGKKAPGLEDISRKLISALDQNHINPEHLFLSILQNDSTQLSDIAKQLEIPENTLLILAFAAIKPAIQTCAEQLSHYLEKDLIWNKGYCPVCGNFPHTAFFNSDGEKHLICAFCSHQWKTKRMGCAYCGCTDKEQQYYFFNEEEKEYRVDVCDKCGKYMKLIDQRELNRVFYPPLEQISTFHLDIQAIEQGYESPIKKDMKIFKGM